MSKPEARVNEAKKKRVKELIKVIKESKVIGIADVENLPASALGAIKRKLRGKARILVSKKPIINRALKNAGVDKLDKLLEQKVVMPALVLGKEDPFKIYAAIKKGKTKAPAKPGQTALKDIIVPAGPTPFTPGPVISELGNLGIKSKVEEGKIVVVADVQVIKEGETFSPELASILSRLNINPMEIGLNVKAMFEKGMVYARDVLDIDEERLLEDITNAARQALNLSIEAGILNSVSTVILIQKAAGQAKALQQTIKEAKPAEVAKKDDKQPAKEAEQSQNENQGGK